MFCILLKKNAAKSLASCWSDVDSRCGFCFVLASYFHDFLYSSLLSLLFILTRLCIKLQFLYLNIVTNPFCSLLNAFK